MMQPLGRKIALSLVNLIVLRGDFFCKQKSFNMKLIFFLYSNEQAQKERSFLRMYFYWGETFLSILFWGKILWNGSSLI